MYRAALHLGALLLALSPCVPAFAHDGPPEAYAVLSRDAAGARAVSLNAGVALRRSAQRYQYVCPMAWGDQFAAPVAALADGTIVVAASRGLMLLGEDGAIRAHPDPAALGRSSALVRSARGVFGLRQTPEGSEVLAIDAQAVRVLWKDTKAMYSLAVSDDKLVLARGMGTMLEQVTLAVDGAELERQMAVIDLPMDYVFARVNAGQAYALVVYRNGTMALGSLHMNSFSKLAAGEFSIAGPLSVDNATLLALDGKLGQLIEGRTTPLADDHTVVCLAEHDGLAYACETDGIARVNGQVLGEPLFRFTWLDPPDLERVPDGDERFLCNSQWQDLRFDLMMLMPDAGTAPLDPTLAAGGGAAPGAAPPTAGVGAQAGAGPAVVPEQQVQAGGSGCATLPGGTAPRGAAAFGLALALAVVACRRRRRHPKFRVSK